MIYRREILNEIEPYIDTPEAVIITGMRRTGKTTLMQLIQEKIKIPNTLFLDLENPINRRYFEEENYEKIKSAFEFLGLDFSKRACVFLDEIQHVKKLPSVIKYFIDHYRVKFIVTGSASFYLKNLFSESLSGRKVIFELFPLTFREFLTFRQEKLSIPDDMGKITEAVFNTVSVFYDEYLNFGGFPEVVLKNSAKEKARAIEDIFTSFFQLEVLQLGDFRRNDVIRDLMLMLIQGTGSKLDIQRISRDLKVSRPALYNYIAFLEGTYFISTVRPFSRGRNTELRKMPKVYICDTGIANHFGRLDPGQIFENGIFQNLRNRGAVNYYQRKSGVEIDFILNREEAFEVKITPREPALRKLRALAAELGLKGYRIVSRNFTELEHTLYGFML